MKPICPVCETAHEKHQAHVFRPNANSNQGVTKVAWVCNHCVTKDEEIARLRNQLDEAKRTADEWRKNFVEVDQNHRKAAKRDRAEYMRKYRAEKRA